MIPNNSPQYKITYKPCNNDKNHIGQLLNFVCLNHGCEEQSLICSLCRNEKHAGHATQPLKFYIEELKKQYQAGARDFKHDFQALEELRTTFLFRFKETVERIAEQFRRLEQNITDHLDQLKAQLLEQVINLLFQQTKQNKFMDFYQSLISEEGQKPQFFIQNYLPKNNIGQLRNIDQLGNLGTKIIKLVQQTHAALFDETFKENQIKDNAKLFFMADNIQMNKNIFTQTNIAHGSKSLVALKVDLLTQFKGKIKVKVTKLKKDGLIYLGAIQENYFNSLNFNTPANWNTFGKIFHINNKGTSFGFAKNTIKAFSENSNFQILMDGQVLKINMKKSSSQFNIQKNGEKFYFFFALMKQTELEVNYIP